MAQPGDRVSVPGFVEWLEFREITPDVLSYEILFAPRGILTRGHVHPGQTERHEVLSGQMGVKVHGTVHPLSEGQSLVVDAGVPHGLAPVADEPVRMRIELRPVLRWESLIELAGRFGQQRLPNWRGYVNPLLLALLAMEYRPEAYASSPPLVVQDAVLRPLAAIARRRGYRRRYLEPDVAT